MVCSHSHSLSVSPFCQTSWTFQRPNMLSRRMVRYYISRDSYQTCQTNGPPHHTQLTKEEESEAGEVPVRREDQDRINRFSRLTQREAVLKEELALKAVRILSGFCPAPPPAQLIAFFLLSLSDRVASRRRRKNLMTWRRSSSSLTRTKLFRTSCLFMFANWAGWLG